MPAPLRACRSASGHTYVVDGPTLRSMGPVTHRLGRASRVAGPETIRLLPGGGARSSLLGEGTWTRTPWGARLAFPDADVILPGGAVGDSAPAEGTGQG